MAFEDRISTYPNRYLLTDENGNTHYVVLERADEPTVPGTPLNSETLSPKNVTDVISFAFDTEKSPKTITSHKLTLRNAAYSPIAGVVFFDAMLQLGGTLASGDTIVLNKVGPYPPVGQVAISCASTTTWGHFSAFMNADGTLKITVHENMEVGTTICLTGWYFCDGE